MGKESLLTNGAGLTGYTHEKNWVFTLISHHTHTHPIYIKKIILTRAQFITQTGTKNKT